MKTMPHWRKSCIVTQVGLNSYCGHQWPTGKVRNCCLRKPGSNPVWHFVQRHQRAGTGNPISLIHLPTYRCKLGLTPLACTCRLVSEGAVSKSSSCCLQGRLIQILRQGMHKYHLIAVGALTLISYFLLYLPLSPHKWAFIFCVIRLKCSERNKISKSFKEI